MTEVCSSAAVAIWLAISEISLIALLICNKLSLAELASATLVSAIPWLCVIDFTALAAVCCRVSIMAWISWVDECVRCDNTRTSSATTAKPRPCSPALAASIAAFKASRLVCSAMPLIVNKILLIFCECSLSSPMIRPAVSTSFARLRMDCWLCTTCFWPWLERLTAFCAVCAVCSALLAISSVALAISVTAVATIVTSSCWTAIRWLLSVAEALLPWAWYSSCPAILCMREIMPWRRSTKRLKPEANIPISSWLFAVWIRTVKSPSPSAISLRAWATRSRSLNWILKIPIKIKPNRIKSAIPITDIHQARSVACDMISCLSITKISAQSVEGMAATYTSLVAPSK